MNIANNLHARVVCHKWKQFVWMLRMRRAHALEHLKMNSPCRWLAHMQGQDLAAIWGHTGAASREIKGPKGPPLFR